MLTRSGYVVDKKYFVQSHMEELTVTPKTFYSEDLPNPFEVFAPFQRGSGQKELHDDTVAVPRYHFAERTHSIPVDRWFFSYAHR